MSVEFKLTASGSGAVKAIEDLNKVLDASQTTADGVTKATKRMVEQAQKIKESNDPQAKYNRQMQELGQLVKVAGLSLEDAQAKAMKYGAQLERASQAGEKAFGGAALQGISKMALQFAGVTSAIDMMTAALRAYGEEQRKAANDAVRARAGVGQLIQLAASDKDPAAAYRDLVAEADSYLAMGAASDRNEAATLTFDLAAAGLEKNDRAFAARMRASGTLTDVGQLAQSYDAMKTALGVGEVGTFEEFASKALAAGQVAPGTVEQLPRALARAGSNAKALGLRDEDVLAAGAVLAKEAGSPEEGGTKLNDLLGSLQRTGVDFTGMSLPEMIERLKTEDTGYGGVFKDNSGAIAAYRTLEANLDSVRSLEADITRAQNQGLGAAATDLPNIDPQQRAANARLRAEGDLAVVNGERLSRAENLRQAALADWSANLRRNSPGRGTEIDIFAERMGAELPIFGDPTSALEQTQNGNMPISDPKLNQEIRDFLKEIRDNTGQTNQSVKAKVTTQQE
jgi:uncharacterized protein YoxC